MRISISKPLLLNKVQQGNWKPYVKYEDILVCQHVILDDMFFIEDKDTGICIDEVDIDFIEKLLIRIRKNSFSMEDVHDIYHSYHYKL